MWIKLNRKFEMSIEQIVGFYFHADLMIQQIKHLANVYRKVKLELIPCIYFEFLKLQTMS